jgi:pimeloyl-ACP methyl ester carboxylesterase
MSWALLVGLALLAAGYVAARRFARDFLRTRGRRSDRTPESMGLEGEPFAIRAGTGTVRGWFLRAAPGPRPTIIFVHGWQSDAGDMLLWAAPLVRSGYHAVVYDSLGHGESDPAEFTSLRHLLDDLLAVFAHTRAMDDTAPGLVLFGHSMGGAAAILAAGRTTPSAIICAGAPTDPLEITREWIEAKGLPGALLIPILRPFWASIIRAPYETLRPVRRISVLSMPVLILHGTADRHVARHHAEQLAAASANARLRLLEGADHYDIPTHSEYIPVAVGFLDAVFAPRRVGSA